MLMRRNNWTYPEACRRIEQRLGCRPKPPNELAEHVWTYTNDFLICRYPGKKIRPLWFNGTTWLWNAPPEPRPLYRGDALAARPTATVLIVEGEKTADAAQRLFPSTVAITWSGGCKALRKTSFDALAGRRVILWPDNDAPGLQAMEQLSQTLLKLPGTTVHIISNPNDVPKSWDLADATWTPEEAATYAKANLREIAGGIEAAPAPTPAPTTEPEPASGFFTCLGFDGDAYYYQPHSTGQIMRLARSAHTSTNLVALAPLQYWEQMSPGDRGGVNWTSAASTLFALNANEGVYNPDRIRGRGVWWDNNRTVMHLGNRLIVDGAIHPILKPFDSSYLYQRMSKLVGPGKATPLSDSESLIICELAERFRWEVPASGMLIAGWVTLAPICGALGWRPHIWITASAGSGKSALLDRYVRPLLADMGLVVAGNTTEAGLRQTLRADALPVVFDEAESNEKNDQMRMQSILALARVASSESHASMLKGSPGGDVTRFSIRSMFLMSSIATALKQGADRSRFAQLTLRPPSDTPKDERIAHWEALEADLDRYITSDAAVRLLARTTALIPVIRQSVKIFTKAAAERFDSQRLGDQYGTLMAGAWSLHSSQVPTLDQARSLIDQNNWEPYSQATEVSDERRCLERILQHQVRVEATDRTYTRTLGELVEIASHALLDADVTQRHALDTMGRYGLRVDDSEKLLYISNTADAIATILRDTPWSHSWATVLCRLHGATKAGVTRFRGAGAVSRAVSLRLGDL
jgi:putative DNA primase/helicase